MNVEIAERLAARRKLAGLSQEALAEKLGVSRQAVSKWERSESSPDTDNLIALAKLYGVSLDELLYVDESIEDDVAFEAADRAEARGAGASVVVAEGAAPPEAAEVCEGAGGGGGSDADADAAANAGAAGAGAAGVGQSVGLWLGILPRGRRGPAVPGFFPADRYPAPVPGYACGRASGCSRPIRKAGVSLAPGEPAPARRPEHPEPVCSRTGLRGVGSLGAGPGRTVFHRCGDPGSVLPL